MATQTQQAGTSFWLTDALGALGTYAAAYANNRLAYESAKDEIALYQLKLQADQSVAMQSASLNGASGIPQQVAGVPTGVLLLAAVAAVGVIVWASR